MKSKAGTARQGRDGNDDMDDGPGDIVLSIDKLTQKKRKSKRSKQDGGNNVDDIVDALLFDDSKDKKKKKSTHKKKPQPAVDQAAEESVDIVAEDTEFNDDDVADLYAWDSGDDEDESAKPSAAKPARPASSECPDSEDAEKAAAAEERQRALRLAMSVADDDERRGGSDAPRDENDWFAKLDEDTAFERASASRKRKHAAKEGESDDEDLPVDLVKAPSARRPAAGVSDSKISKEKREAIGKYLAIDCEMVGAGLKGSRSMLARVSIVNYYGHVILDTYVKPLEPVTDYRTWVSGIRKADLAHGRAFKVVQEEVATLVKDRVLVGHAIKNDLAALMISHPPLLIRDTSRYPEFKKLNKGAAPALRKLAASLLSITIQEGEHSSVTDAKTTMLLYRKVKDEWELTLAPKRYKLEIKKAKSKERFAQLRKEIHEQQSQ
ncbi:3'-5' exonuclease [Coemansia pectinata]|uniref:RNA exonuclease 4 n=1 Tax=Coemansia pectinata TaxID=1052879 RepID=A0A9W8LDD3_9FUNG|nr:3'-5' exonuclease [Coemansia pectinata]